MNNQSCDTCANRYPGADGVAYCRPANSFRGIKCSAEAADGCQLYEPKPVTADRVWYCDQHGRGD